MEYVNKIKAFVLKYKYYILGVIALFVVFKLLSNRGSGSGSDANQPVFTGQPSLGQSAPVDNSMAILQSQQQFQLAQQKLAFQHENDLADKQLQARQQENALQQQINQGNIELEKTRVSNEKWALEQNANIAKLNAEIAERNANAQLAWQSQNSQLNANLKLAEIDANKYIAGKQFEYQKYQTDKQTQIAKKQINAGVITGIVGSAFDFFGNSMSGGAYGTAKQLGTPKTYAF